MIDTVHIKITTNECKAHGESTHLNDKCIICYHEKTWPEILNCLVELSNLKAYKDQHGKTEYYLKRQPELWAKARELLS